MAVALAFPVMGLLVLLQTTLVSQLPLLHGTADLVLLVIIAWALQKRVDTAWHWTIIGGLMISMASALPFGVPLIGYLLATSAAYFLRRRVWQAPILAMLIVTLIGTLLYHGTSWIALQIAGNPLDFFQVLNLITLPSLILNSLVSIPVFAIISDLAKWLYPETLMV